jgi:hypothetical protein
MPYYEKLKLGSFCHIDDLTSRQNANLRDGLHGLLVWEPGARRVRVLGNADDPFMKPFFEQKLVALPVDLIVTWGTPAALAAKQAPRTIPIDCFRSGNLTDAVNKRPVRRISGDHVQSRCVAHRNGRVEARCSPQRLSIRITNTGADRRPRHRSDA